MKYYTKYGNFDFTDDFIKQIEETSGYSFITRWIAEALENTGKTKGVSQKEIETALVIWSKEQERLKNLASNAMEKGIRSVNGTLSLDENGKAIYINENGVIKTLQ